MAVPTTLGGIGMAAVGSFPVGGSADPLVSGLFLFLDGVNAIERLQAGSLEMNEGLGGVKHLEYLHQELTGGLHISSGQKVILRQGSVNIFLGTIDRLEEKIISGNVALFTRVEALDLNAMLERRLVTAAETYTNQTAGFIVNDLVTKYLTGEGLTTNSVQTGATLPNFSIKAFTSVAKALRNLNDRTGFISFVDSNNDLHFKAQTQVQAPFNIGDAGIFFSVIAFSAPDSSIWKVVVTNDGILQTVLSVGLTPTSLFLLASDASIWEIRVTNDGLLQTVLTSDQTTIVGFQLTAPDGRNFTITVTKDGLPQTRPDMIAPLDSVNVGASRERYRNRQTVRHGSDLTLSVTVNDTAEQDARKAVEGGSGIYHAVEDASEILSAAEATAFAEAKLRRFGAIPQRVQFATLKRGLKAGQTLILALAKHNIFGDFLIDQITVRDDGNQILIYGATAFSGEHLADNMLFWRKAVGE